ncbi:uncharacterized protein LOC115979280 isoform X1 [Quercus lobata]|uniref:uncharacterized protein LOC115979280 isoform X1 n=1 Tax=Quercus lobata TaxID=97700 RepID=UPI001248665E|nr:uncharacterized protein LOC115979280 isoform X1 [Quercus lobata]
MEEAKGKSWIILHNAVIVTMDPQSRVFRNGGIVIDHDSIKAIGQSSDILRDFSALAHQIIDLNSQILLPGLINTHVHTSQQLGRGIADDVDLMTWLHGRIWPYESNMTEEDSYISTLLCAIELIHSGVTCFAEAGGQHVSGMARAVELLGLRACLAQSTMDAGEGLPATWVTRTTDECIQVENIFSFFCFFLYSSYNVLESYVDFPLIQFFFFLYCQMTQMCYVCITFFFFLILRAQLQKELYNKYHNTADGRIRVWFGIRQIMNSTDRLLLETRDAARQLKTGIHMHVAEIPYENQLVMDTRKANHGTVTHLEKIEFLQNNLLAAHTVWVNNTEIGFLSRAGVKVSHCPAAAMRMLGFAPIREMLDAGICVSLGTDGAPSNNRMSIVDEMYLASLINKGREVYANGTTDPTALPAETVLRMVTINGAKSVLWDDEIGSLEVGKKADMVVINPSFWTMVPIHDWISSLVYCMRTENVVSVMCNGQWIMKDKKILNINEEDVISMAQQASSELLKRAGIIIPKRMNIL